MTAATVRSRSSLNTRSAIVLFLLFPAHGFFVCGQPSLPYPEIRSLLPSDIILKQLHEDLEYYYVLEQSGGELPFPAVYQYTTREGDDLFSLAARFNLPYEALATLNRFSSSKKLEPEKRILVSNQPGIFVHPEPSNELESFIKTWRSGITASTEMKELIIFTGNGTESVIFLQGERFHPLERAFFLGILFRNPIPSARLTSGFGTRKSPISGEGHFHRGIDLAAPMGTDVIPAREGIVTSSGENSLFGKYILISHPGGWETFYAHLKKSFVELNQTVTSSMIIGEVGDTGQTTGPHLHFELRRDGSTVNPESLLPGINDHR